MSTKFYFQRVIPHSVISWDRSVTDGTTYLREASGSADPDASLYLTPEQYLAKVHILFVSLELIDGYINCPLTFLVKQK